MNNIKFNEIENSKIVSIDFSKEKRNLKTLFFAVFGFMLISIGLPSGNINYNTGVTNMRLLSTSEMLYRLGWSFIVLISFTALYYFLFYPLSIKITKKQKGAVTIEQRGSFFKKYNFFINEENNLFIFAKKRRFLNSGFGFNTKILLIPRYEMFFVHKSEGVSKEIAIFFEISHIANGVGTNMGLFKKEEIEEISNKLDIPVTFD